MAKSDMEIELDSKGIAELLKSADMRAGVDDVAAGIESTVRASLPEGTDVARDSYTTDRVASSITIRDISGKLWQARDGVLTRAAAAAGLEVRTK